MKINYVFTILVAILFFGGVAQAQQFFIEPLQNAYIKVERLDWQTYEFSGRTNIQDNVGLNFTWTVDGAQVFYTKTFQHVFTTGAHVISMQVADSFGNRINDTAQIQASFWQVTNPWLWWLAYFIIVAFILYYWVGKVVYLAFRKKFQNEAKIFLDTIFDERGFVSKVIETKVRKAMLRK
ncbi:MAG: hypothetical protein V1902_01120 [Candidatus Falkowbacteria bacterium]